MSFNAIKRGGIPLIFFVTTIVAYGLFLPQMGFYWDDWPFVWIAKFLGPADFFPAFANIRPFLAPIFYVTTSLIPLEPIYWQIFMLLIRFASGLLAWFLFKQIWPQYQTQALVVSLLFLVFPAYSQHWVAFTHINQEWIAFLFYLLSFGFTARALRNSQKFTVSTLLALLFLIPGVFPTEYFVTLEPLRFLFIWAILGEKTQGFWKALKLWLPYFFVWLANIGWLAYYYTVGSYGSYDVEVVKEPLSLSGIILELGSTIWKAGFYQWVQVIGLAAKNILAPSSILTIVLIVVSFAFFLFYLLKNNISGETRNFALPALLIGVIGILLGRLPSFAAGLPLRLQTINDRFTISMMIGGSLFIVGLVELVVRDVRAKNYVFALLIALGIGQQFFTANLFRRDWLTQQELYSQLAWRIPAMQPGTLLMTDQLPVDYDTDISFTAAINWLYAPEYTRSTVPYALIYTEKRLGGTLRSFESGEPVNVYLRTDNFAGSTSQAIVFQMPRNGCLRVLGSEWGDEITYGRQSQYLVKAIPLSNPGLIETDATTTPVLPFLGESEHTWCYYYTRAELARQQKDWNKVIQLYDEATTLSYEPSDPVEWFVFIEAHAMTGNMDEANQLSHLVYRLDQKTRKGLCQVWQRVQSTDPVQEANKIEVSKILSDFQCAGLSLQTPIP